MISEQTKKYLVDYLTTSIAPSIPGTDLMPRYDEDGRVTEDKSVNKLKQGVLCEFFERYLYYTEECRGIIRISRSGQLWIFNGKWYEKGGDPELMLDVIKRTLRNIGVSTVYRQYSCEHIYKACILGVRFAFGIEFVPDRNFIVFRNGILDVKKNSFRAFYTGTSSYFPEEEDDEPAVDANAWAQDIMTDLVLDIDYDPAAFSPLWDAKLMEIIPNPSMRDALQMFCGMMLANRDEIRFEYAAFIIGPGSNGKSVIASAIANVFGREYFGKFEPKQVLKNNDSMFNMAALEGMIANFTDDLSKDDISGGMFKRFVSGEEFPARHPYGRTVFNVKAPLMLCCTNEMPSTTDDSWGHHRRILPILSTDFIRDEKDKDVRLASKLCSTEIRQAIFNWIYEGYKKVVANDGQIILGAEVREEQERLRDDSNSARRWVRDACLEYVSEEEGLLTEWKSLTEWHKEYIRYCEENGDHRPRSTKGLAKVFQEKGFVHRRSSQGWRYLIRVNEDAFTEDDLPSSSSRSDSSNIFRFNEDDIPF